MLPPLLDCHSGKGAEEWFQDVVEEGLTRFATARWGQLGKDFSQFPDTHRSPGPLKHFDQP